MAKVLILTVGSRGDIQPYVALGKGLQRAGHRVALQTIEHYRPFVEAHGLEYAHINNEFMKMVQSESGQAATEGGGTLGLMKQVMPILRQMLKEEWQAAEALGPDIIVYHPKALGGYHIAEALRVPTFLAIPLPLYTPTRAYPIPIVSGLRLGGAFNRVSYRVTSLIGAPYAGLINDFRVNTLGLKKRGRFAGELTRADGAPVSVLYPYSPQVVPVPPDYPPHVHVTGYWFLGEQEGWQPPTPLAEFLAAGEPPVYIGFGSMSGAKAEARGRLVLDAIAQAGVRAVLASGWGGLKVSDLPPTVTTVAEAPHDWLFPKMAAVVHHGGAGTTAAGLRAGKPALIVPFIADQPFWGKRVHELAVGPAPISQRKLNGERLAAALTTMVSDPGMRLRAEALGAGLRAEDGVGTAVALIERALAPHAAPAFTT